MLAHVISDMCPVLLFHVGIIFFFVRTRAGKLNALSLTVIPEVVINKLRTIGYREGIKKESQSDD